MQSHVRSGDKIAIGAESFNTMLDAGADYLQRKAGHTGSGNTFGRKVNPTLLKNMTGDVILRGSLVGVGSAVFSGSVGQSDTAVFLDAEIYDEAVHGTQFAITSTVFADEKIGGGFLSGACMARVSAYTIGHLFAIPSIATPGTLESAESGPIELLSYDPDGLSTVLIGASGSGGCGLTGIVIFSNAGHKFCNPVDGETYYESAIYGKHEILSTSVNGEGATVGVLSDCAYPAPILCESIDDTHVKYVDGDGTSMPI